MVNKQKQSKTIKKEKNNEIKSNHKGSGSNLGAESNF